MSYAKYTKKGLLNYFEESKIPYKLHKHEALFSVEDSKNLRGYIEGAHTKNLFLKDKKKNYFLLTCIEDKKIDLKKIKKVLSVSNLSFGSDTNLEEVLGVMPGSVSPFGLINDTLKKTKFMLDSDILKNKSVNFHPLVNNFTLNILINDFITFIEKINVELNLIYLDKNEIKKYNE